MAPLDVTLRKLRIKNAIVRNALCEFFCTAVLMWCGTSVCAQTILTRGKMNEYVGLALGWGLSLLFAVQLGIRISGAHLNPAVSLFFLTIGRLDFVQFLTYTFAQMAGGFAGACLTWAMYYEAIDEFDKGTRMMSGPMATAGIFTTFPAPYLSVCGHIIDQLLGTAFLVVCVGAVADKRNQVPVWIQPLLISLALTLIGLAFSMNAGYAINPARDLSPRLACLVFGYSPKVFTAYNNAAWVPAVIPMVGAVLGGWVYTLWIGVQLPDTPEDVNARLPPSLRQPLAHLPPPPPLAVAEESTGTFSNENAAHPSANSRML
ncbi:hypothetical protein M3Y99_01089400 [Aphelenchoides fujianensis]|nr:hypothetical protein M3Y99_01089400 [Aphelenchoides fujianensis]